MSLNLIAVTAVGGLPLFTRQMALNNEVINEAPNDSESGQSKTSSVPTAIPFATLACLNGVNLFARLNDADLLYAKTDNAQIRWKVYKGSIVLIIIAHQIKNINERQLEDFLDIIFDSLTLMCGLTEITSQNIERLKRCLRLAYPIVDHFLNYLLAGSHASLFTASVEYSLAHLHLREYLASIVNSVSQLAASAFCCAFVEKKLVVATKNWWSRLTQSRDAFYITNLIYALPEFNQLKELPIYLPENCPTCVTRLIIIKLFSEITICLLCAENPTTEEIENQILLPLCQSQIHQEQFIQLFNVRDAVDVKINENVIALLVIRGDLKIWLSFGRIDENKIRNIMLCRSLQQPRGNHLELCVSYDNFKCYHLQHDQCLIFSLFPNTVNFSDIRAITSKTLNTFSKDKHIWP